MSTDTKTATDTELEIVLEDYAACVEPPADIEAELVMRWAEGVAGPCPVCGYLVDQGDDCKAAHFNKALSLTQAGTEVRGVTLAEAIAILKAEVSE